MAQAQIVPGSIEAHALARHVRMSPQKARLVMDLIRGQKAQSALQTLQYTQKRAAKHIEKVLRSAIANAERKADEAGAPLDAGKDHEPDSSDSQQSLPVAPAEPVASVQSREHDTV